MSFEFSRPNVAQSLHIRQGHFKTYVRLLWIHHDDRVIIDICCLCIERKTIFINNKAVKTQAEVVKCMIIAAIYF